MIDDYNPDHHLATGGGVGAAWFICLLVAAVGLLGPCLLHDATAVTKETLALANHLAHHG